MTSIPPASPSSVPPAKPEELRAIVAGYHQFIADVAGERHTDSIRRAEVAAWACEQMAAQLEPGVAAAKCPSCDGSGIVRSLGRDNNEIISDCPQCSRSAQPAKDAAVDRVLKAFNDWDEYIPDSREELHYRRALETALRELVVAHQPPAPSP